MQRRYFFVTMVTAGIMLAAATGYWLVTATPANAQCGSQASSCKNCHEVQGQDPVNGDGTAWHTSHAFGDFCYICHAGNNQATDQNEAHLGMAAPLSDVKASCLQCHPDDLQERAQVYATALGMEIGSGASITTSDPMVDSEEPAGSGSTTTSANVPDVFDLDVDDPNLVDYTQRYNEIVLGEKPVNWGNMILLGLIGLIAIGGGGFVIKNEKWLDFSAIDTKRVEGEYPSEVVDMLPAMMRLKPRNRKALRNILENPSRLEKVLGLIDEVISDKNSEEQR